MNPLGARMQFRLRPFTSFLPVLGIFILIALAVGQHWWAWLVELAAIGVLFYFYFYIWQKKPVVIRCPHCGKSITTNTPWICGFCQQRNEKVDDFPFIHRCEHCGAEPKAYKCHHRKCGELVFLSEDELEDNYARCVGTVTVDEEQTEVSTQAREKRKVEHELIMAELTAKLNEARERADFMKKKDPYAKVEEKFTRHQAEFMAVHEIARNKKKENAEKYRDDPELQARANEVVDAFVESHS